MLLSAMAFGAAAPRVASAQGWLEDRERAEGRGIRLGNLELHPGLGAEVGYDTNVFNADQNEQGSAILRITPHLYLSTLGAERSGDEEGDKSSPPSVIFKAGVSGRLYHHFSTSQKTDVEGDLDLRLTINPERPFSVTLYENFGRTIRPFTESGAAGNDYARDRNLAGAQFDIATKGGVFKTSLGYDFGLDFFEGDSFRFSNYVSHRAHLGSAWRFFPQTALLYDFELNYTDYISNRSSPVLRENSARIRNRIGVNGALSQKVSALLMIGHGAGFYSRGPEYESVVGQAELRLKFTERTRLAFGYERDFFLSRVGSFYRRDEGYANLQLVLGGAFLLGLEGRVGYYDFGATLDDSLGGLGAGGNTDRTDVRASTSLFGEYRVTDWLAFNASLRYTADLTDFEFERDTGVGTMIDPADYSKFEAWVGARIFY